MSLRMVFGKSGSGKSDFCFSEIAKIIDKEKKIFIITPEQFSFYAEKKLLDKLNCNAVINAQVVTLSRMANLVLNEVGVGNKTPLSKPGKAMIIYSILNKFKTSFKFLGKSDENIDVAIKAITEFKKHGITVEDLKKEKENATNISLKSKLEDMTIIFEKWEERIGNEYLEENDLLTLLSENLDKTDFIKDSIIYIDEFVGFTYQEYEVIKKFMQLSKKVTITFSVDNLNFDTKPETDTFYTNKKTALKILNLAKDNKIEVEKPIEMKNQYRFKNEELKYLGNNLYSTVSTKYKEKVDNIKLFIAKNQYTEIENVAKQITKLVREDKLRYKDISIITKQMESYSALVRAIFMQYNIPVFIDERRDLNQNIIIQYFLSILDILQKSFSQESVLNYMKLGFCDIDSDEIFMLENYCTKWGIKQNKWKKDFNFSIEKDDKKQQIERLNEIRKDIINPLIELKEKMLKEKNAINFSKCLYEFMQNQKIEEKITEKINQLEERGFIDIKNEYQSSYKIIIDLLDEMVMIFSKDKMSIDNYSKIFKIGLKNSGLGKIPATQDQVTFGNVDRSKSHKVKAVFIIGLNDGVFPSIYKEEGFLNDKDREILKEHGIELANGTTESMYEDNFNIYKAFTTSEEKLFLSYASSDSEGKSLRPSILISKIKRIFENIEEESDVICKKYELMNPQITYNELIENLADLKKGKKIENIWYQIYKYYKLQNDWKEKLESDLNGLDYTNLPEDIDLKNIEKLYGNKIKTSISQLERYRSCPFSYYLQYGLRIKEKEEFKIQSFNTGEFMHETIDEFFETVREKDILLVDLEEKEIEKIVSEIMDKNLNLNKNYIFQATAKYKVLTKRLKKIVSKALKYIIETLIHSDFNIEGTEVEFAEKGKYKPIVLELENGKKVEITGKIDRIDTATGEDGRYIRIIDYKSSSKNIDLNEVYAGLQIQLLTYADAICKEEDIIPAGVFYFSLLEQMIKAERKISEEQIEEMIKKNFKMKGLILADVKIIKMNDNTLKSGSSKLVPAAITASGEINKKWTNGVSKEEFKILQDYIDITIKEIAKEILKGKIDLKPYNKKGKTPCEYCSYKSICRFNPSQNGNNYNYIDKKSKDDIMKTIKEQINDNNIN